MNAIDLLRQYIETHPYGLSDGTIEQLEYSWGAYTRHTGVSDLRALTTQNVNVWIDHLCKTKAPDTARTQRGNILAVWWYAYREGIVDEPPLRARKVRPISRDPIAWTPEEVQRLLYVADHLQKFWRKCNWSQSLWTGSLFRAAFDSALRLSDLLELRYADIQPVLRIRQHKTRRHVLVGLRNDTIEKIRQCVENHGHEVCWPLWGSLPSFYAHVRKVVRMSGVRKGTFRYFRRAAVTHVECAQPGAGTLLAGHSQRTVTEQFYIDKSQVRTVILPPR